VSATAATQGDAIARAGELAPARRLPAVPAEEELLLLTAGGAGNDPAVAALARGEIDWQRLLGLAQVERAVPVIYPRLRTLAGDIIPPEVLEQMRRLALVSDFAMLHLDSRLRESLGALHGAGIRVLLLKGAALAHTVYAGVRQRPMSDIDLLVDSSSAHVARRVMLDTGWREIVGGIPDAAYEHHHHLPPLRDGRAPDLQLEVHTALFPERQPFAFDVTDLWAGARPLGAAFPNVFVPSPIHSLLHACLHFLWSHQGRFGVWRTVRDIDLLSRHPAVDWTAFSEVARAARGGTSCYWTLRIADMAAGVAVPAEVMRQLQPPRSAYVLRAVERHFMRNLFPLDGACPSIALEHALWELAVMPSWSGHGDVRPWDEEPDFVVPPKEPAPVHLLPRRERVRRLLASPGYIRALLRSGG